MLRNTPEAGTEASPETNPEAGPEVGPSATEYVGHITVEPPLNRAEQRHLAALAGSPSPPPGGWPDDRPPAPCPWVPVADGARLVATTDDPDRASAWLRWLVHRLLKPGARARGRASSAFDDFTFDHVLDGVVVGCTGDSGRVVSVSVTGNTTRSRELRAPIARTLPPLELPAPVPALDPGSAPRRPSGRQHASSTWPAARHLPEPRRHRAPGSIEGRTSP